MYIPNIILIIAALKCVLAAVSKLFQTEPKYCRFGITTSASFYLNNYSNGVASTRGIMLQVNVLQLSLSVSHSLGNYYSHAQTLIYSHTPCTLMANTVVFFVDFSLFCIRMPIHSNVRTLCGDEREGRREMCK